MAQSIRDVAVRASKTFVQAAIASVPFSKWVALVGKSASLPTWLALVIPALAAGVSGVMNGTAAAKAYRKSKKDQKLAQDLANLAKAIDVAVEQRVKSQSVRQILQAVDSNIPDPQESVQQAATQLAGDIATNATQVSVIPPPANGSPA